MKFTPTYLRCFTSGRKYRFDHLISRIEIAIPSFFASYGGSYQRKQQHQQHSIDPECGCAEDLDVPSCRYVHIWCTWVQLKCSHTEDRMKSILALAMDNKRSRYGIWECIVVLCPKIENVYFDCLREWRECTVIERINLRNYRKSSPSPICKPRLQSSLFRATRGTPKLISTRTGSKRYRRPTPTVALGCEMRVRRLSFTERAKEAYVSFSDN